jgi:hypothetical protein
MNYKEEAERFIQETDTLDDADLNSGLWDDYFKGVARENWQRYYKIKNSIWPIESALKKAEKILGPDYATSEACNEYEQIKSELKKALEELIIKHPNK